MKKIFIILLLLTVFIGISAVSAADNISSVDNALQANDALEAEDILDENGADAISSVEEVDVISDSSEKNVPLQVNESNDEPAKKVVQVPKKVKTKNIKSTYGTKAKFTVKVYDKSGKSIAGQKVKIKIGKKAYKIKTDSDGVATLKLNYPSGKYTIKYTVGSISGKNTYTVKNKVTMTILKWGNKGNVAKIRLLKKNMPNNKWVKKAVKATKKGNPLLKFEGGKGKKVFITAGVHGNELSSQVAAMKLISRLSKKPIKGTVYIIPFVNIKAISHKVRHTGTDYNRVAHKSGTISNKIVKLVKKYDCDAYGDFHTTQPGGAPGQNIVMGSKSPAKKSADLTNYIAKHAKVHKRIYKYAGQDYPGALADNVNKKGIPAVICEVVLPHNTVTSSSVKISFNMMKAFLKFNSIA